MISLVRGKAKPMWKALRIDAHIFSSNRNKHHSSSTLLMTQKLMWKMIIISFTFWVRKWWRKDSGLALFCLGAKKCLTLIGESIRDNITHRRASQYCKAPPFALWHKIDVKNNCHNFHILVWKRIRKEAEGVAFVLSWSKKVVRYNPDTRGWLIAKVLHIWSRDNSISNHFFASWHKIKSRDKTLRIFLVLAFLISVSYPLSTPNPCIFSLKGNYEKKYCVIFSF